VSARRPGPPSPAPSDATVHQRNTSRVSPLIQSRNLEPLIPPLLPSLTRRATGPSRRDSLVAFGPEAIPVPPPRRPSRRHQLRQTRTFPAQRRRSPAAPRCDPKPLATTPQPKGSRSSMSPESRSSRTTDSAEGRLESSTVPRRKAS
jgi:hypothetical protein